jgi:predicted ribosomally synthesized peptide with nif11-like leader
LLELDNNLQVKVKAAENPQQIINIAESTGYVISQQELRTWSAELSAHYFPWATQGNEFRRNFFKGEG